MYNNSKVTAIINIGSRSTPADAAAQLSERLEGHINALEILDFDTDKIPEIIDQHTAVSDAPLIVWGGDGTICYVLEAVNNSVPVLALPGGTMNMVHQKIHGQNASAHDLLESFVIGHFKERKLAKASANGHPFFVAAMLGELTQLTDVREAIRAGQPLNALGALASQDVFNFDQDLAVSDSTDTSLPVSTDTAALAAFINAAGTGFDVGQINPDSLAELLALSIEVGVSNWKNTERVKFTQQDNVLIEGDDPTVKATLDGEPIELSLPLNLKLFRKGSRVLSMRLQC